jgi:hypothetical protein
MECLGPSPEGWQPEASCHLVGDAAAAIEEAQELAGERTVFRATGSGT